MSERIDAIFENGVFRPEVPVNITSGQRVSLDYQSLGVEAQTDQTDDLVDVADLLDVDFMESCHRNGQTAPSLDEVRSLLSGLDGALADRISDERDER